MERTLDYLTWLLDQIRFNDVTVHALAGGLGSVISMGLLYPLDTVRLRLQVDDKSRSRHTIDVLKQILKEEGWEGVYRGANPVLKTLFCSYFVYFFAYTGLQRLLPAPAPGASTDLILSLAAAMINVVSTAPLFLVQTRMKLQTRKHPHRYTGLIDGMLRVCREEGVATLWRGTVPSLILCINPALQMTAYQLLKRSAQILFKREDLGAMAYFLMGAASKIIATIPTYPIQVIQSRMRSGQSEVDSERSVLRTILRIFRIHGVAGLYGGLEAKLLQTILNAALMFMFYEKLFLLLSAYLSR